MIGWNDEDFTKHVDDLQDAIFKLNDYLNVNEPVRASRVLKRIQVYLDQIKEDSK